jgi:hypothetical protein
MGLNYLGCYKDNSSRDLKAISGVSTPEQCFKRARDLKYEFVAL